MQIILTISFILLIITVIALGIVMLMVEADLRKREYKGIYSELNDEDMESFRAQRRERREENK